MKPRWLGLVPLLASASPALAAAPAATPLETCIQTHLINPGGLDALTELGRAREFCYEIAANEAQLNILRINQKIYANQLMQNNVLLTVVVLITITGLALSALQLWASYRLAVAGQGALADSGGDIAISPTNVAVKSSFVGVLILGISLAFFTLYITYVYQLRPYDPKPGGPGALTLPAPAAEAPPANMTEVPQ